MPEPNGVQVGSLIISIIVLIIVIIIVIMIIYNYNNNNSSNQRVENPQEAALLAALAYKNGRINGSRLPNSPNS